MFACLTMYRFFKPLFFVAIIFCSQLTFAKNLVVELPSSLPKAISNNIFAHLGDLPKTEDERRVFIFNAPKKTNAALRAMGYYRAEVNQEVITRKTEQLSGVKYYRTELVNKIEDKLENTNKDAWRLTIQIKLNEATLVNAADIKVIGPGSSDPAFIDYLAKNTIAVNKTLSHQQYEKIKSELAAIGVERGYFDGKLFKSTIEIREDYSTAKVTIIYQSGERYRFGKIKYSDFDIEKSLLEKLTPFHYGDPYNTSKLLKLQRQLQQTQYFGGTMAVPDKTHIHDNHIPINVNLNKAKAHYFNFGVGYSTDTLFRITAAWRTPLINRYGHRQETKIEYSKVNPKGRFTYSIPLSHPVDDLLQFQIMLTDDEYGDISSNYLDNKIANLRVFNYWTSQFYVRNLNEKWSFDSINYDVMYNLPGVSFSNTSRKGPQLDPSTGFSQYYTLEGGADTFGSEIDIIRVYGRWRYIQTLKPKHRVVLRGELGASFINEDEKDLLPPSLRFYAGGDQSIRGYAYQSLGTTQEITTGENAGQSYVVGGTRLIVASIEYQYYLSQKWRSVVFSDAGNALDQLNFKAVHSVGSGIHYLSSVGPIRLDFGYSISEENPSWRLHFTLGAEL